MHSLCNADPAKIYVPAIFRWRRDSRGPTGLDASLLLEKYLTALAFARSTVTGFLPG
jgi:hypothetical protein